MEEAWLDEAPDEIWEEALGGSLGGGFGRRLWEEEGDNGQWIAVNIERRSLESYPGLLTGFRSETAEMVLNARLATENLADVSPAIRREG